MVKKFSVDLEDDSKVERKDTEHNELTDDRNLAMQQQTKFESA